MRLRTPAVLALAAMTAIALLAGCSGSSTETTETIAPGDAGTTRDSTVQDAPPPLADEALYQALLAVGLERYDLTIADGTYEVLQSMEGYGAVQWTSDATTITITHRDIDGEWEWTYTDDTVDVDSATPDPFTDADKAAYLALATKMIEAIGEDATGIAEIYTWKAPGGVMQGDYRFGDPDAPLRLHIATDAEGRLGYSYMRNGE
ncbi:MAG: hypothetical protein Kow0067_19200 [Coriobacteriia bacterium]